MESPNSRWASIGLGALRGLAQGGVRGAAAGAVTHALDPTQDERFAAGQDVAMYDRLLGAELGARKALGDLREQGADIGVKKANEEWLRRRPDLKAEKNRRASFDRERAAIFRELGAYKGQRLDPSNPVHASLIQRAAQYGVGIDPDSWNASANNLASIEVVDPDNPTRKRRQFFNKATGEVTDAGMSGYVAPRDSKTGLTPYEAGTLSLSGERVKQGWEHVAQGRERLALSTDDYARRLTQGMGAAAVKVFNVEVRGLMESRRTLQTQLERWKSRTARAEVAPDVAAGHITALETAIDGLDEQMEVARTKALSVLSSSAPAGGSPRGGGYTEDEVRARARRRGVNPDEAVREARAQGLIKK